jgi:hypothetical protein
MIAAIGNALFTAASGAHLKLLVEPEDLVEANSRFESTTWTALILGPPLGGCVQQMPVISPRTRHGRRSRSCSTAPDSRSMSSTAKSISLTMRIGAMVPLGT